jgi:hypothetical protein
MNLGADAIIFVIYASLAGGLAILAFLHRYRDRHSKRLLRIAAMLGGTVRESSLYFRIDGHHATIEYGPTEEPQTRVRVLMPRRTPGVLRILRPANAIHLHLWGTRDLQVGHAAFDREWYITSRPEALVSRVFSQERIEQVIASVDRLGRFDSPAVEITRDTLVVRVDGFLFGEPELTDLVKTATDFVGYVKMLGPDEGIAWVVGGEAEAAICPVCTVALAGKVVHCDKCRTPHHEECWTYVGRCSTYACKGKRFVA